MSYKMLVCDIDGTLLNAERRLTEGVKEAIREATRQGIIVTLASGRQLRGVMPLVERIGVSVPVIAGNGCVIADPLNKQTLLHRPLEEATTKALFETIGQHGLWSGMMVHTFEGVDTYYDRDPGFDEAYLFVHTHIEGVTEQVPSLSAIAGRAPIKVLLLEKTEKMLPLIEDLQQLPHKFNLKAYHHDFPGYTFLEMYDHLSSKATAIAHLAQSLGITREEVVAVGDNDNDVEMIEYAGLGVAMGNATEELKQIADWVTKSNDEDGVAFLIREKMLS